MGWVVVRAQPGRLRRREGNKTRDESEDPDSRELRGLGDGDDDERIRDDDDDSSRRGCVCLCVVKGDVMRCDATRLYTSSCAECMYSDEQEKQKE